MTNHIEIDVETTYLSSESNPEENKYYFLSKGVKAYLNNESAFNHLGSPKNFKEKN